MFCCVPQCARWNRVSFTAVSKHVGVVRGQLSKCGCTIAVDDHPILAGIVGVGTHFANQTSLEYCLLVGVEGVKTCGSLALCPAVEQELRFEMDPVRAPIGSNVGAVAPNRGQPRKTRRDLSHTVEDLHSKVAERGCRRESSSAIDRLMYCRGHSYIPCLRLDSSAIARGKSKSFSRWTC